MWTPYHSQYWAHQLNRRSASGTIEGLSRSIANARVDLNPHQVDAAMFALRSPLAKGALLADEVGLGKTIEAGIVLTQKWAERRRRLLLIVPATLRKQWQQELIDKFYLPSLVLEARAFNQRRRDGASNPFDHPDRVLICSYQFAAQKADEIRRIPWDLVVIDEAHRLRNVYKPSNKLAKKIAETLRESPKLLLTATPLQNSLMELYGLISIIDEHTFGDAESFRERFVRAGDEDERNRELRERLKPICTRTLRKQVTEYVEFTRRVPITQDFTPSDDEHRLYEEMSGFLQRPNLISLPNSQRKLITMVLRKLMASSTFAIAGTLRKLVFRLESMKQDCPLLDDEDLDALDEIEDEWSEADQEGDGEGTDTIPAIDPKLLREELGELRRFSTLADSISVNQKGEALLPALTLAFERATKLGANRKAVLFTESRRTQQYLFDLLTRNGYTGQVVLVSGTNSDPHSQEIYKAWTKRYAGQDCVSGSKPVDIKAAIVEEFRERATILVATEAAAEGVNLQFCSLVVNFDLPWNPQRIEQRIGRCHRYGQKHDVVVVNFLNRRNEADQRVFELLSEKFRLFDGVFGASDEVLGALESGVDLERRIAQVYQECRTSDEIRAAFDRLREELEDQVRARMASTRQLLLDNLDEEVTSRLRIHRDQTKASLDDCGRLLLDLTRVEAGSHATFDPEAPRFRYDGPDGDAGLYHLDWEKAEALGDHFYRPDHPLAARLIETAEGRRLPDAALRLDYDAHGAVISILEPLRGRSGWLECHKLTIQSFDVEEFLIVTATTDDGAPLDDETVGKLLCLPARVESGAVPVVPDLAEHRVKSLAARAVEVDARNGRFFDEEVLKLDRWSEDLKLGLEHEIKDIDREIRETKKLAGFAGTLAEKLELQKKVKSLESTRKDKRKKLYESQDEIDGRRDTLIEQTEKRLKQDQSIERLFGVRWELV